MAGNVSLSPFSTTFDLLFVDARTAPRWRCFRDITLDAFLCLAMAAEVALKRPIQLLVLSPNLPTYGINEFFISHVGLIHLSVLGVRYGIPSPVATGERRGQDLVHLALTPITSIGAKKIKSNF